MRVVLQPAKTPSHPQTVALQLVNETDEAIYYSTEDQDVLLRLWKDRVTSTDRQSEIAFLKVVSQFSDQSQPPPFIPLYKGTLTLSPHSRETAGVYMGKLGESLHHYIVMSPEKMPLADIISTLQDILSAITWLHERNIAMSQVQADGTVISSLNMKHIFFSPENKAVGTSWLHTQETSSEQSVSVAMHDGQHQTLPLKTLDLLEFVRLMTGMIHSSEATSYGQAMKWARPYGE